MDKNSVKGSGIKLGEESLYVDQYDASLLAPIARSQSRDGLSITREPSLPFTGVDLWTGYELSWLNLKGKPQVAIVEFEFDCDSLNIIESKSFKYYLNSFNQTPFKSRESVIQTLTHDLQDAASGRVSVRLFDLDDYRQTSPLPGVCVDDLDIEVDQYQASGAILNTLAESVQDEALYSHLLKSNCPVTGQPDWATIWVEYSGLKICQESFLQYVISFRQHQDFHENCVEKIFMDLQKYCLCSDLSVYARYTRRGGLDINPYRTSTSNDLPLVRLARQ